MQICLCSDSPPVVASDVHMGWCNIFRWILLVVHVELAGAYHMACFWMAVHVELASAYHMACFWMAGHAIDVYTHLYLCT